jgi:hypothetical protein
MVKVSIFSIIVAVLLVNIVLHHLINWWFRNCVERESDSEFFVIIFVTVTSLVTSLLVIDEVTS